ncbi:peptidase M22, glycoprotease [Dendrothele bispora CBS 962.96]|uniref:N(6)-L-threonylcarbamoyladenine synthase n=1 Tax=Dendrothele bispora (strain CBS 962.96) TaxID=1314807 RepID=A0A4S8MUW4_DENBC|nr:peptidase M22, glycoprotease [Dendrothele bispora CBS 962.96]
MLRLFRRPLTILAFESSADDTCAAVLTSTRKILSNVVIKQHEVHESWGGIHPAAAVMAHQRNMPIAAKRALTEAGLDISQVDGIAFTRGPGIGGCLGVSCNAAKTLAAVHNKPVVGVHHMQAHALTPLLTSWPDVPSFPFLTFLVSGGHTLLVLAESLTSFKIIATTRDESIGRTFDKVSRMLELSWDGIGPGAALERFCAGPEQGSLPDGFYPFPRPMPGQLAFSYASLHSHVERYLHFNGGIESVSLPSKLAIARSFQLAAFSQLEDKLLLALQWCANKSLDVRHLVVSGGVASNTLLRERLNACLKNAPTPLSVIFPPPSLCTDNAVMIAWASMHRFLAHDYDDYSINPRAKWSIEELHDKSEDRDMS